MGLQGEKKLEDILTGALIGLARTTYSHLKTENTDRVVTCALSVLVRVDADEKELEKQLEQVRAEKLAVAPGCATCVAKCGNTDDYDMDRFWNGPGLWDQSPRIPAVRTPDSGSGFWPTWIPDSGTGLWRQVRIPAPGQDSGTVRRSRPEV